MPGRSLTTLILQARQSADMENDPLCDDTEVTAYINDAYGNLYDAFTKAYSDLYLKSTAVTLTTGQTTATIPADFNSSRGLDWLNSSGLYCPVPVFTWRERNTYHLGRRAHRIDSLIRLMPETLDMSGTYRLWYIPLAPVLVLGGDTLDTNLDRWAQYIVDSAAARMLVKAKLDPSAQLQSAQGKLDDMIGQAANRDSDPEQSPDIYSTGASDWYF
jgi:hypothetical protein